MLGEQEIPDDFCSTQWLIRYISGSDYSCYLAPVAVLALHFLCNSVEPRTQPPRQQVACEVVAEMAPGLREGGGGSGQLPCAGHRGENFSEKGYLILQFPGRKTLWGGGPSPTLVSLTWSAAQAASE